MTLAGTLLGIAAIGFIVATWMRVSDEHRNRQAHQSTVETLRSTRDALIRWQITDRAAIDINGFRAIGDPVSTTDPDARQRALAAVNALFVHMAADPGLDEVAYTRHYLLDGRLDTHFIEGAAHGAGHRLAIVRRDNVTLEAHAIGWWDGDHARYVAAALADVAVGSFRDLDNPAIAALSDLSCDSDGDGDDDLPDCIGSMYLRLRHVAPQPHLSSLAREYATEDVDSTTPSVADAFVSPLVFGSNIDTIAEINGTCDDGLDHDGGQLAWSVIGVPLICDNDLWRPALFGEPFCRDVRLSSTDPRRLIHTPGFRPVIDMAWRPATPPSTPVGTRRDLRTRATDGTLCPSGFETDADNEGYCVMEITDDPRTAEQVCEAIDGASWTPAQRGIVNTCVGNRGWTTHAHDCTTPEVDAPWGGKIFVSCQFRKHRRNSHVHRTCHPKGAPVAPALCTMPP